MQLQKSTARGRRSAMPLVEAERYRNRSVSRKLVFRFLRPLLSFLALAVPFLLLPRFSSSVGGNSLRRIVLWDSNALSNTLRLRRSLWIPYPIFRSALQLGASYALRIARLRRGEFIREKLDFMCQMMLNWPEPDEQRYSQWKKGSFLLM